MLRVILSFRIGGSKDCIKRAKAIKIAQLLIKSNFGEVKGRFLKIKQMQASQVRKFSESKRNTESMHNEGSQRDSGTKD